MKAAALKALELDQNLAEGWTALGACAAFHEWDWAAAEKYFQRALDWLERAYVTRAVRLSMIKIDPRFETLRDQPRFQALVSRMNLD